MSTIAPPEPDARPLTTRQAEVFRYLYEFTRDHGYQPSSRELCVTFQFRPRAVTGHLYLMARKGWLAMSEGQSRAVRFLRRPDGSPFTGFADKDEPLSP